MKNKKMSLFIIFIIYVISILGGLGVCLYLKDKIEHPIVVMLMSDIACTILVYIFSLILKNSSVYDPYWSVIPVFIMLGYVFVYDVVFDLWILVVCLPFLFWALRLTTNWIIGFDNLLWQDWRYVNYKNRYPKIFQLINFGGIMLMPTLLVFAGTIPFYFLINGTVNQMFAILGGFIILMATIYQLIADVQMKRFKKNNQKKNRCIDEGVWKYTRHPNYFAEIMIWWGLFIASIPNVKMASFIGAVSITALFIFISIPLMEKHILMTRSEYQLYQRRVPSPLVPFPRKKEEVVS